jgi:hypothetical protein
MTAAGHETEPRFTVVIPTKDRAPYLFQTLRTCTLQDYDRLEVIVSDDGSVDATREVVEEAARKDPRIRYVSPGRGVGMLDNFEFALDQVRPGFVLALGGDDGLMPHGIRGMRDALAAAGTELLAWPAPAYFYAGTRMPMAQLVLHLQGGRPHRGERMIESSEFLRRQARELTYVSDVESPMFYVKGVTSTRLVERVRARTPGGRFYACATPDGYSGIVLAGEVGTYAFSGMPFTLHGVSPTSAGVSYLAGSSEARQQSEAFFRSAAKRPMHAELGSQPYSPLIALMTADYLLTTRDLPGWPGIAPQIDFRRLLQKSLGELRDGLFAEDRVVRELGILRGVARHHGLESYFIDLVSGARRNTRRPLERNAVSPARVYIDATQHRLENVLDASYFAHVAHTLAETVTVGTVWDALVNSARYRLLSARAGAAFPPAEAWPVPAPEG